MIEDKATEKLKKRLQDMGLIVNASADKAGATKSVSDGTEKSAGNPKNTGNPTSKSRKGNKR